jgi:multidrug efflux system membrane fusion protein
MKLLHTLKHKILSQSPKVLFGSIIGIVAIGIAIKVFSPAKDAPSLNTVFKVYAHPSKATNEIIMLRASGTSKASRKINLTSETSGQVYRIHHQKGHVLNVKDPVATIQLDDRSQMLKEAKANYDVAKENLDATKKLAEGNFRSELNLKTAQAEFESAAARLARVEKEIENTRISAPFKGVLGDVLVEEGSVVAPGVPVATLLNLDPILIQTYVSEKNYSRIRLNETAQISLLNNDKPCGKVTFVSSIADPKTHMFLVEISVENPDFKVPDGATAQLMIPTPEQKVHKISPSVLSIDQNGIMAVKVINAEGIVESYPIQLVQSVGDTLWVTGLPDETIVIDYGSNFVGVGEKVQWDSTEPKGPQHAQ